MQHVFFAGGIRHSTRGDLDLQEPFKKKDLQELVLNECQMMMQCSAIHQESNQIRLKQLAGA
jgi:hypothetical protein